MIFRQLFLLVTVKRDKSIPIASFQQYDEKGNLLYEIKKSSQF